MTRKLYNPQIKEICYILARHPDWVEYPYQDWFRNTTLRESIASSGSSFYSHSRYNTNGGIEGINLYVSKQNGLNEKS